MRDGGGGEPPIRRAIRPDQCEGNRATHNLARGKRREGEARRGQTRGKEENSGKYRVSDSREGGE
jgi:hypothetical protein